MSIPARFAGAEPGVMLPLRVIHYASEDPRSSVGGVQRFGLNLQRIFAEVRYVTPGSPDRGRLLKAGLPIICDNQRVLDWPAELPVIGFQHGVAAVKHQATHSFGHWRLERAQRRAAERPHTLWVACADWVARSFGELYGNAAREVIYYPVDTERFDGQLENKDSRLVLHDARTRHKGKRLIPRLQRAFPEWCFEPLACPPEQVPDRMRGAAAFIHLSRYEGNSLVCGEAMAMNLPCLFTRVGLMRDRNAPSEVQVIDPELLDRPAELERAVGDFLGSLGTRPGTPRRWILSHATIAHAAAGWRRVMVALQEMSGWDFGLA